MSTAAPAKTPTKDSGPRIPGFAQLQRLGKSLMLPIALLAAACIALPAAAAPLADRIAAALRPLGITRSGDRAGGGPDLGPLAATGVPAIDLGQDGTRYFDIHHTADDTLDRIDPKQLAQNVAAWTTMLSLVANAPEDWGAMPPASTAR